MPGASKHPLAKGLGVQGANLVRRRLCHQWYVAVQSTVLVRANYLCVQVANGEVHQIINDTVAAQQNAQTVSGGVATSGIRKAVTHSKGVGTSGSSANEYLHVTNEGFSSGMSEQPESSSHGSPPPKYSEPSPSERPEPPFRGSSRFDPPTPGPDTRVSAFSWKSPEGGWDA